MKNHNFAGLKRVNKTTAHKLYDAGKEVIFTPCCCRPTNDVFALAMPMQNTQQNCIDNTFEQIVNAFEYYNCNSETGNYTAFYVEV